MSAFDTICTKSTADSSWDYKNVVFVNISDSGSHIKNTQNKSRRESFSSNNTSITNQLHHMNLRSK